MSKPISPMPLALIEVLTTPPTPIKNICSEHGRRLLPDEDSEDPKHQGSEYNAERRSGNGGQHVAQGVIPELHAVLRYRSVVRRYTRCLDVWDPDCLRQANNCSPCSLQECLIGVGGVVKPRSAPDGVGKSVWTHKRILHLRWRDVRGRKHSKTEHRSSRWRIRRRPGRRGELARKPAVACGPRSPYAEGLPHNLHRPDGLPFHNGGLVANRREPFRGPGGESI